MIADGTIRQTTEKLRQPENWVASYLGNGNIGGCFDYAGLQFQEPDAQTDIIGDTYFVSQHHYVHGKFGMDYALPIGRLQAKVTVDVEQVEPRDPSAFEYVDQILRIDRGFLHTKYLLAGGKPVEQVQFFSQKRKNLFVLRVNSDTPVEFDFKPVDRTPYHYNSQFETQVVYNEADGDRVWEIPTNLQTTAVIMRQQGEMLAIAIYSTLEVDDPVEAGINEVLTAHLVGWDCLFDEQERKWERYWSRAQVSLPHPLGAIWRRANYYLGCSLNERPSHPPLVFGLACVQWPAYFPQDFFYAYTNTLTADHLDLAAGTSGFWHNILPHAQDYALRLFNLAGAVYPWTPPVFDWHDYHCNGITPNKCYYELHNSAYVAKMCWDYYTYTLDESYLREKAYPVIREIARMYASMTIIRDGRAHILFAPIQSQDETGPPDMPNYFDAMVSAEYCLTLGDALARKFGEEQVARDFRRILDAGYVFDRLELGDTYGVFEGDTRTEGFQKHPVQLNPITWLPIERFFNDARIANYHRRRYEICRGYKDATSTAWTLGQFMLASCRLGNPEALAEDIENILRCSIMDADYIQTFESSRKAPHFLTTIGLFMQAITETLVQTCRGRVDIFGCLLPEWENERIEFSNLRTPGGFLVSGHKQANQFEIEIESLLGGELRFSLPRINGEITVTSGGVELYNGTAAREINVNTRAGDAITVRPA